MFRNLHRADRLQPCSGHGLDDRQISDFAYPDTGYGQETWGACYSALSPASSLSLRL